MLRKLINDAPRLWQHLNGVISVYKPAGVTVKRVQSAVASNICRDLNQMEVRPPGDRVTIEPDKSAEEESYLVVKEPNLADHTLVVGERYQMEDIRSIPSIPLGKFTSGVMLIGINGGIKTAYKIRDNRPIRVYHVTGRFGTSTETHFNDSTVTLKAKFEHVSLNKMNSFLASLQASHQKKMHQLCGVDMQSQSAYELAVQGPLRPAVTNVPLIYSLRCIDFMKPYFTIEIHAINESEAYLGILIHEIGLYLKSVANCTRVRCIRQSHFTLEDSLVRRHWNVENILNNMARCRKIIQQHPECLKQLEARLHEDKEEEFRNQ